MICAGTAAVPRQLHTRIHKNTARPNANSPQTLLKPSETARARARCYTAAGAAAPSGCTAQRRRAAELAPGWGSG
eukprot:scaffold69602_cov85-Phaeocystis_antarctica.AAC.1